MRLILLALLSMSLISTAAANPPAESFDKMDQAFPNLKFVNPEGETSTLADYKGKVVLIKLWATWCPVCRDKWPEHQALYDSVKNESDVQIITLSVAEDPKISQNWVAEKGYDVPLFTNLITDRGAVQVSDDSLYFIKGTPMKFLIDKDGVLRKKAAGYAGSISEAEIRDLI